MLAVRWDYHPTLRPGTRLRLGKDLEEVFSCLYASSLKLLCMCVGGRVTRLTPELAFLVGYVFQHPICGRVLESNSFEEESEGTTSYGLDCDTREADSGLDSTDFLAFFCKDWAWIGRFMPRR